MHICIHTYRGRYRIHQLETTFALEFIVLWWWGPPCNIRILAYQYNSCICFLQFFDTDITTNWHVAIIRTPFMISCLGESADNILQIIPRWLSVIRQWKLGPRCHRCLANKLHWFHQSTWSKIVFNLSITALHENDKITLTSGWSGATPNLTRPNGTGSFS